MKIADLGTFTKPVLICGGAYGNLRALEALAELQLSLGISDSHIIHSGDAVAYCADTEATAEVNESAAWLNDGNAGRAQSVRLLSGAKLLSI